MLREQFVEEEFLDRCAAVGPRSALAVKLLRDTMDAERLILSLNKKFQRVLDERNELSHRLALSEHLERRFADAK